MASISPKTGVLGLRLAKHLLRRTTFAYSKSMVDQFSQMTVSDAVDILCQFTPSDLSDAYDYLPTASPDGYFLQSTNLPSTFSAHTRKSILIAGKWFLNAKNDTTITHKLVFFLHNQFTTERSTGYSHDFYDYLRLLHFYSHGNIKDLSIKMTFNNHMLKYLNNNQNTKNKPNENFAREFLELFTIGKGPQVGPTDYTNYTEEDIVEFAKILTGFTHDPTRANIDADTGIPTGQIVLSRHNTDDKVFGPRFGGAIITGATTEADMLREFSDFVDLVFDKNATSLYLARKLYRYFVRAEIDAETEQDIIIPLANELVVNGYEIIPAVKLLLKSVHFYDEDDSSSTDEIVGGFIKSPLSLMLEALNFFKVDLPNDQTDSIDYYRYFYLAFVENTFFTKAGYSAFLPESVAGYPPYYQEPSYSQLWFNSSTIIARYKLGEILVSGKNKLLGNGNGNLPFKLDVLDFVQNSGNFSNLNDPSVLVDELLGYCFAELSDASRKSYFLDDILLDHQPSNTWGNAWQDYLSSADDSVVRPRLEDLFVSIIYSPEYQLH